MESAVQASETYRVILTRRRSSEILFLPDTSSWALPSVGVFPHRRLAEQLTREVGRILGVPAYCLLLSPVPRNGASGEAKYTIMEAVRQNDHAPRGGFWVPRASLFHWIELAQARIVEDLLAQLDIDAADRKLGPFSRPGWLRELLDWVQEQIRPFGIRLTGAFRQLNASPTFSLVRLETNRGAVWFKATGEPNTRELPVTIAVARLLPRYLPRLLGVHTEWNGWLTEEVRGNSLDQTTDPAAWERAAEQLADLEIESISETATLLGAQVKDLRVSRLAERIDLFFARMAELMAVQEKPSPRPLSPAELAPLAQDLRWACALLDDCGLPNTLGHIDFNPGNILIAGDRSVFLDWAEACVAHPVLTFEYLREHAMRCGLDKSVVNDHLTHAYLGPWSRFHPPEQLRRALALGPLIAVFAYAVATDSWRSEQVVNNSNLAGYFRSLARRMYRETARVEEGSELCHR